MGTVPSPYSPVAGDDATQARVLTWADGINYLLGNTTSDGSKRPFAILRQTVAQSLTTAVETAITFDTEDGDRDNGHSTVTNTTRYTAQTAGWYHVDYVAAFAPNATGGRYCFLKVNGVGISASVASQPGFAAPSNAVGRSMVVFLAAGDFLELFAQQSSGGALLTAVTGITESVMVVQWWSV